jgi:hypothetical protein
MLMELRNESSAEGIFPDLTEIFAILHASCFKWIEAMHPAVSHMVPMKIHEMIGIIRGAGHVALVPAAIPIVRGQKLI